VDAIESLCLGQTGHPDHLAVHRWTTSAFSRAAPTGARLHYSVIPAGWREPQIEWLRGINVFSGDSPKVVPEESLSINFTLSPELNALKVAALEKHASQFGPFMASEPKLAQLLLEWNEQETFVLGATRA